MLQSASRGRGVGGCVPGPGGLPPGGGVPGLGRGVCLGGGGGGPGLGGCLLWGGVSAPGGWWGYPSMH